MACYISRRKVARVAKFASAVLIVIIVLKQIGAGTNETESPRALENVGPDLMPSKAAHKIAENAGFKLAADLHNLCKEVGMTKSKSVDKHIHTRKNPFETEKEVRISYSRNPEAVFCPMCKVASTFWTRFFKMMIFNDGLKSPQYRTPFDIEKSLAAPSEQYYDIKNRVVQPNIDASSAFKFLFVRSPYSLLFSAYGDKIIKPVTAYFEAFGRPAVRRLRRPGGYSNGSDVTFAEFVDEVVFQYRKLGKMNCHVETFSVCRPCSMNYTFVGKLETFKQDTNDVLSVLGQQATLDIFKTNFTVLHAKDAIDDVTYSVFSQRDDLKRYMQWPDGLRRVWRQLQVRGVINQARFPLTSKQADIITLDEFRRLINDARLISKPEETKRLKKLAFIEAFRSVPASLMAEIRDIYKEEFLLFQYDTMPEELYDKDRKIEVHGFLNFSNIDEDLQPRGVFI